MVAEQSTGKLAQRHLDTGQPLERDEVLVVDVRAEPVPNVLALHAVAHVQHRDRPEEWALLGLDEVSELPFGRPKGEELHQVEKAARGTPLRADATSATAHAFFARHGVRAADPRSHFANLLEALSHKVLKRTDRWKLLSKVHVRANVVEKQGIHVHRVGVAPCRVRIAHDGGVLWFIPAKPTLEKRRHPPGRVIVLDHKACTRNLERRARRAEERGGIAQLDNFFSLVASSSSLCASRGLASGVGAT